MKFQGALIKEQGVTFAVIVVKQNILQSTTEANKMILTFCPICP
jgi:hypothetical protein